MEVFFIIVAYAVVIGGTVRFFMKLAGVKSFDDDALPPLIFVSLFWPISLPAAIGYKLVEDWFKE